MAIVKDEALVLGRRRLGESSLIVTLFTAGKGPVRAVAKGARKARSRFGGALEPTNLLHVVYYAKETRDLQLLSQADVMRAFSGIRESLLRLAYAYAIIECLVGLKREEGPAAGMLALAGEALASVERSPREHLEWGLWSFLLAVLEDSGFRPELGRCLRCNRTVDGDEVRFDARAGGVVCPAHGGGGLLISGATKRLLEEAARGGVGPAALDAKQAAEGREALRRFLVEHDLGRSPFRPLEEMVRR